MAADSQEFIPDCRLPFEGVSRKDLTHQLPALLILALELPPKLRSTALRLLGKQALDSPVDSRARLGVLVLPGQIKAQARIPIAAELCVDYLLGVQHVAVNTLDHLVLVHITGCITPLEALAQLLLPPDAIQHADACRSQKAQSRGASRIRLGRDPTPAVVSDCHTTSRIKLDWL